VSSAVTQKVGGHIQQAYQCPLLLQAHIRLCHRSSRNTTLHSDEQQYLPALVTSNNPYLCILLHQSRQTLHAIGIQSKICNRYVADQQSVQPLPQSTLGPAVLHRPSVNIAEDAKHSSMPKSIKDFTKYWTRTPRPTTICHCFEKEASQKFDQCCRTERSKGAAGSHLRSILSYQIRSQLAVLRKGPGSDHTITTFTRKETSRTMYHSTSCGLFSER